MEPWKTKEKHKIGKKRDFHTVKICVPTHTMDYVQRGLELLQKEHGVPVFADIMLVSGWNQLVKATWRNEH